jgi:xylulokinase
MYNDARSRDLVPEVRRAGVVLEERLGLVFDASFALPKILWLARERPAVFARARHCVHAADFIVGRLTGEHGISDHSNSLKTGYDVIEGRWPAFIGRDLGIPLVKLPRVLTPGALAGRVGAEGAAASGLPSGTPVLAGATDGMAAQIASGAVEPGTWNSSLGTTLVVKWITKALVRDPEGRIYSHRHPEGWWMPGGASNTGAEWIGKEFPGEALPELDARAAGRLPTRIVRYPLARRGERFPFRRPEAEGFLLGKPRDRIEAFAAGLEGTAFLERLAYETLIEIGAAVGDRIHVTGGGARSEVWLRVRASVLGRTLLRPAISETAMGAALLAASGVWFGTLSRAARAMVRIGAAVEPDPELRRAYGDVYETFLSELRHRGYLSGGVEG